MLPAAAAAAPTAPTAHPPSINHNEPGAGLSTASGIPTFRHSPDAVWSGNVWTSATRDAFRKNPLEWWNSFWLESFPLHFEGYSPNDGHEAIADICNMARADVKVITQNVDGLHQRTAVSWNHADKLVEAHGRLGLYKCIPSEKQEEEEDRLDEDYKLKEGVHERRARRAGWCDYSHLNSLTESAIVPEDVRCLMSTGEAKDDCGIGRFGGQKRAEGESGCGDHESNGSCGSGGDDGSGCVDGGDGDDGDGDGEIEAQAGTKEVRLDHFARDDAVVEVQAPELPSEPRCPKCDSPLLPQALMFDESYSSHDFYNFDKFSSWFSKADTFIFVGTSFSVTVTDMAIREARKRKVPVFNFNLESGRLEPTNTLNVENVVGKSEETLAQLSCMLKTWEGGD